MKVNAERKELIRRIKEYDKYVKSEHKPLVSERKQLEMELLREQATERNTRKHFARVALNMIHKP